MFKKSNYPRRPVITLAVAATALFCAIVSTMAFAEGTPPKDVTLPTFPTGSTFTVGKAVAVNHNEWIGATSFTYAWQRCSSTGVECASIPGATSSEYIPTINEIGHTLQVQVTGHNAAGSTTVTPKTGLSPVKAVQHWYSCTKSPEGAGVYSDSACGKQTGAKSYSFSKLTSPSTLKLQGGPITITYHAFTTWELQCRSVASSTGTIENPSGGGAGVLTGSPGLYLTFSSCTYVQPSGQGCEIKDGQLETASLAAVAEEIEGKPALTLHPVGGAQLATWVVQGCATTALDGAYSLTGTITGFSELLTGETSSRILRFLPTTAGLKGAGLPAQISGTMQTKNSAGEMLLLAP